MKYPGQTPRILLLFVAIILIAGIGYTAPPVRDKVLEEVRIVDNNGTLMVEVHFSFPLRYQSHFPQEQGEELRVQLRPVRVPSSDLSALYKREGVVPRDADAVSLDEVIYEGDMEGGPYLTLRFTRPVSYEVIPGSNYRSMIVVVLSIESPASSSPE